MSAPGSRVARIAPGLALASALALPAGAVRADDAVRLEAAEVEATPIPQTTGRRDPSAFATVIPREDFEGRAADLADVLDDGVGVQIRSFGGLGDFSTISIRGSTAQQVEVFLDGIPLNRASGGGVDLSTLPLASVERIEVYRGTAPARLAVSNVGGAVELVTLGTDGPDEATLSAGFGSFGTARLGAHGRTRLGALGLLGVAGYERTDGDFEFDDDNGTPFNAADDERVERRNNGYDQASGLLKADLPLGAGLDLTAVNDLFYKDEGVPGIGAFQSDSASLTTLRELAHLRLGASEWLDGLLDASQRMELHYQDRRFRDLDGDIGIGAQDNREETFGLGSVTEVVLYPTEALALTAIADLRRETFQPENELLDPAKGPESRRHAARGVGQAELTLWDDRVALDGALRFAYVDDRRGVFQTAGAASEPIEAVDRAWTWKIGGRLELLEGLALRGNASTAFRAPSFDELFGDRGSVIGNPELDPESGFGWDLGLAFETDALGPLEGAGLEVVYFRRDTEDLILLVQNSQRTVVPRNISEARAEGVELVGWLDAPAGFRLTGNATFQSTEDRSRIPSRRGKDLPGQPETDVYTKLEWRRAAFRAWADLRYIGENFIDAANLVEIDDRVLVGAGLAYSPLEALTLRFEAINLTDDRVSDVFGFPLPGTSFFGSMEWRFGA